jgi:lipopolysaccharide export system permease protein
VVPFGILSRYVTRALVRPFFLGFGVVTFILVLEFLLDYLDLFLGKGIPILTVGRLFVLGLGWMVALSVPCGVLVAVLMAYGQMSQDNEVTALRASGVNLIAAMLPALTSAVLVGGALATFNNYVLPETNHAFANLVASIHRMRPTAQIQEGIFIDDFEGYNLFIRKLDDRTGRMRDVLIIDATENRGAPRTIIAHQGELHFLPEQNAISLTLRDGEIHEADPNDREGRYHRLAFEEQTMQLKGAAEAFATAANRNRGQREMSVAQMKGEIGKLRAELSTYETQIDSSLAGLGVSSASEVPSIAPRASSPRGLPRLLGAIAAVFGGRRGGSAQPDVPPETRRKIEDLNIRIFQADAVRKRIDQYEVEIHKKFSIPFACIVFVLVGAPLGMRARRGGLAAGFLSVAFFLFYYLCLIGGEQLADRGLMSAWLSMWLPNVALGLFGIRMTWLVARTGFPVASLRRSRT